MTIVRMPIERPTGKAQLQPLAEAAKSEEEGAALARATLAANVSPELAEKVDVLQVGLALRLAQHHIQLCEYESHWGTACMIAMLERAQLLFRFSGRVMSMSPPTWSLPEGLGKRDNETRTFFCHYPPPEAAVSGFFAKSGHATTETTFHVERAAESALPKGVRYPFACQFDIFTDLFEAPTDLHVADGKRFSYKKHYLGTLSKAEAKEDERSKIELLKEMMIAERQRRGRVGLVAYIAGVEPDLYAPALLEKAAALATTVLRGEEPEAASYTVRRPTDLPEATCKKRKGTPSRVAHPCMAAAMPIDERLRNDAVVTQVQGRILAGAKVRYFEAIKTESADQMAALAGPDPYDGPFPPTNEKEEAEMKAAIARYCQRNLGGDPSAAGRAGRGAGCGKGSAQRKGGQNQGGIGKNGKKVYHTCKKCHEIFACKLGTQSTKHSNGCGCNGLCRGFKRKQICLGCADPPPTQEEAHRRRRARFARAAEHCGALLSKTKESHTKLLSPRSPTWKSHDKQIALTPRFQLFSWKSSRTKHFVGGRVLRHR